MGYILVAVVALLAAVHAGCTAVGEHGLPCFGLVVCACIDLVVAGAGLRNAWEEGGLTADNEAPVDTLEAVGELDAEIAAANNGDGRKSTVFLPYSESTFKDGSGKVWRQIFGKEEAAALVTSFNSLWGRAARMFAPVPIFAGHPDVDPEAYKNHGRLGEIVALNEAAGGVTLDVEWTDEGVAHNSLPDDQRRRKPSPVWKCRKVGDAIHPYHLLSVGLTNTPNIKDVPAWNEAQGGATGGAADGAAENGTGGSGGSGDGAAQEGAADGAQAGGTPTPPSDGAVASNENIVAALRTVLEGAGIVQPSDSDDTLLSALGSFLSSIQWARREATEQAAKLAALRQTLGAANEATAAAEAKATTAQALADKTVEAVTAANAREEHLRTALVGQAVAAGAIAEHEREAWAQKLAADVTAANDLPAKGTALNVAPIGILSRQRRDITAHNETRERGAQRDRKSVV